MATKEEVKKAFEAQEVVCVHIGVSKFRKDVPEGAILCGGHAWDSFGIVKQLGTDIDLVIGHNSPPEFKKLKRVSPARCIVSVPFYVLRGELVWIDLPVKNQAVKVFKKGYPWERSYENYMIKRINDARQKEAEMARSANGEILTKALENYVATHSGDFTPRESLPICKETRDDAHVVKKSVEQTIVTNRLLASLLGLKFEAVEIPEAFGEGALEQKRKELEP